ncbi:hypothetical protein H6G33_09810 [Calothrix sp. FACHB-1219]|uniref:hypothetical protein n=1 Tax=unclassified Calothrix TaxID=2619626 RepID=UPI001687DF97|nr:MULTISPECIES: hypothetical protein [unclassified Calothrix]MBD2201641.1 hypothetical protein [Calothrix sp. FACHB-168]MBD2217327.1 hypothetical protein [Calothrix sp. FACHB-1219]
MTTIDRVEVKVVNLRAFLVEKVLSIREIGNISKEVSKKGSRVMTTKSSNGITVFTLGKCSNVEIASRCAVEYLNKENNNESLPTSSNRY